jgi:hypothetical protein
MTRICGNCFWFAIKLPSCIKLHKAGSSACSEWSPDAKVILWQREQEKQDKQTITAMVNYIAAKCDRCPAYRKNGGCPVDGVNDEDCEKWILEYFTGEVGKAKVS